jgi:CysZ protein
MLRAISLGFANLSDKRIMLVLGKVIALTLIIFGVLGVGMWFGLSALLDHYGLRDGGTISALIVAMIMVFSGWLLFRTVAVAMTWIFSDDIVDAVEERHYAFAAAIGKRPRIMISTRMAVRSVARAVGYNLLMLPVYLILLFTGIGTALAFLLVNGYLMGRDLEDMLTARHGKEYAQLGPIRRFVLGLASVAAMLIPLVQFIVPVVATAAAVHMVHDKTGKI